jgi:hypothetical protein
LTVGAGLIAALDFASAWRVQREVAQVAEGNEVLQRAFVRERDAFREYATTKSAGALERFWHARSETFGAFERLRPDIGEYEHLTYSFGNAGDGGVEFTFGEAEEDHRAWHRSGLSGVWFVDSLDRFDADVQAASSGRSAKLDAAERRLAAAALGGAVLGFLAWTLSRAWRRHRPLPRGELAELVPETASARSPLKGWPLRILGIVLMLGAAGLAIGASGVLVAGEGALKAAAIPIMAVAGVLAPTGVAAWRHARQHLALTAAEALGRDPRPPVVYLRSFRDDRLAGEERRIDPRFARSYSEEEQFAMAMGRIGPFVAVGRPGEHLPQLGAARVYVTDERWQETVAALIAQARLVALRIGGSKGLRWEVERAVRMLSPDRLLLLVPPGEYGYEAFRAWAGGYFPHGLPDYEAPRKRRVEHLAAIYFEFDWRPRFVRLDWEEAAPRAALGAILRGLRPIAWQHRVPDTVGCPSGSRRSVHSPYRRQRSSSSSSSARRRSSSSSEAPRRYQIGGDRPPAPRAIGHGILAAQDEETMRLLREADTVSRSARARTSSRARSPTRTRSATPCARSPTRGVAFTIATDEPEMMQRHLRDELALLLRIGALERAGCEAANARGHSAAFVHPKG